MMNITKTKEVNLNYISKLLDDIAHLDYYWRHDVQTKAK